MTQNVPEASDDIEAALPAVKIFGAYGPDGRLRGAVAPHGRARLDQNQVLHTRGSRDASRARAIRRAHIQQRTAARRDFGDDHAIDCVQISPALVRYTRVQGRQPIIGRDRIEQGHPYPWNRDSRPATSERNLSMKPHTYSAGSIAGSRTSGVRSMAKVSAVSVSVACEA